MKHRAFVMLALLMLCACAARAQVHEVNPQKPPDTLEDKLAQADVVLLGTVKSVAPAQQDSGGPQPTREPFMAVVRVEELFKGAAGSGETATVLFTRAHRTTRPALVDLQQGERAVFYLRTTRGGALELVSPFYGKETADYRTLQALRAISEAQGLAAEVGISLSPAPGGGAAVLIRVSNGSSVPVIFAASPAPGLVLRIERPDGRAAPPRPGAAHRQAAGIPLFLPGNGTLEYTASPADYFIMNDPGMYTVRAVFDAPAAQGAWSGSLVSQSLQITVE